MNKRILYIGIGLIALIFVWIMFSKGGDRPTNEVVAKTTQTQVEQKASTLYQQAVGLKNDGELLKAKAMYQTIIADHSDFQGIDRVQKELEQLNMQILFSNTKTEQTVVHEVVSGDTLGEIAKKYRTTIELIKRSNNLSSDVIRIGQRLRVWTGTFNIFVDKSQNILMLKNGDQVIKVYRISTGTDSSTPIGEFKITSKLVDPVWFNKGVVLPPESPQNVLGTRWLGFDIPGYGIHGTIEPETIGQQVTAGCVRMRNEEVEELYSIVPIGTEVVVVN